MKKVSDTYSVVYKTDKGLKVFTYETEDDAQLSRSIIKADSEQTIEWLELIPSKLIRTGRS
ncbi:hypothetical protein ABEY43_06195 [Priestia megaterium]